MEMGPGVAKSESALDPIFSLIVPIFRSADNIADLILAISALVPRIPGKCEVIFVDDGSPDKSGQLLLEAQSHIPCSSKIVFHSRNFGSFTAIRTGLEFATGKYFAAMAADLQEPPELLISFFEILSRNDADVVFGERQGRNEPIAKRITSNMFWWLYRKIVMADIPKGGVDIFACNRDVRDTVLSIEEPNSSLIAQLFWVGYRRSFVPYLRRKRLRGQSAWNFARRLRYMMDSIFSFSDAPIVAVFWAGVFGVACSVIFGFIVFVARILGYIEEPGYAGIILVTVFFGSTSLLIQGIIGSYLWRTFENTKRRPLRIVARVLSSSHDRD
jgi:glycosyltransferase involved in cell wall biosynthesis